MQKEKLIFLYILVCICPNVKEDSVETVMGQIARFLIQLKEFLKEIFLMAWAAFYGKSIPETLHRCAKDHCFTISHAQTYIEIDKLMDIEQTLNTNQ